MIDIESLKKKVVTQINQMGEKDKKFLMSIYNIIQRHFEK